MKGSPKSGAEENTFIKAYEDVERASKSPVRGSEAYPLLEIVHGPKQGAWFTVAYQKEVTLGRAATNSIVLEDNSVSRSHAVLQSTPEGYTARDIGSRNGTFLNGKKIQDEMLVKHMDIIKVGIYTLRFLQEPTEQNYEPESKEEHTPRVAGHAPVLPSEEERQAESEPETSKKVLARVGEESAQVKPINEELQIIEEPKVISSPAPVKKTSRSLRSLMILLIIVALIGWGGYLAYRFGALGKLKTSLGGPPKPTVEKAENTVNTIPKVIKPETAQQVPPSGQTVPVFIEADSQPVPAKVFYQGNELGMTPFKISVQVPVGKPQELSAEFPLEGINQKWAEKTTIQVSKQDELVTVKFQPKWAQLKVVALPKDGQLYLEGKFQDTQFELKPMKLDNVILGAPIYLPYGKYAVEIRQPEALGDSTSKVSVIKYRRDFELNPTTTEFDINASDEGVKTFPAQINTDPTGVDLFVDGKKMGTTPFKGDLPTGRHKLVLKKEGFNDFEKEISIDLNTPYTASYNLNTTAAGEFINKGRELIKKTQYNEAIEQFAEALKHNPEPTELSQIHLLLGKTFLETKTYDQALAYFQRVKDNPEYSREADLGMAQAYAGLGQPDQALVRIIDVIINTKDEKTRSDAETIFHKISPMRSVVYVTTDPPGAAVSVNGNAIGQMTPVILSDLLVGSYRIGIQKDGFNPYETRISLTLSGIKPLIVKLEPKTQ